MNYHRSPMTTSPSTNIPTSSSSTPPSTSQSAANAAAAAARGGPITLADKINEIITNDYKSTKVRVSDVVCDYFLTLS